MVGPVAAGKTTLANRLGPLFGLPVRELDDSYWRRGRLPDEAEWAAIHREIVQQERWIIAGDYRAVASERFRAADVVLWLDLPRRTCVVRATLRKLGGNPAPLLDAWRWIVRYRSHGRVETVQALADPDLTCTILRVRRSGDVRAFLSALGA